MYDLGTLYEQGDHVKKDLETAYEWYTKSADAGYEKAIEWLNQL